MNKMKAKPAGEESEAKVPTDLRKALTAAPKAKAQWTDLTPIARRDFISWLDSAKQLETRKRRIERACSMLAEGKRRPCCYSIVSFNLFTALPGCPEGESAVERAHVDRTQRLYRLDGLGQTTTGET